MDSGRSSCWSSSAAIPSTPRRRTSASPSACRKCRCASTSASSRTRRRGSATGTCPRPITWKPGATPRLRRHGVDRAAADRAALPGPLGPSKSMAAAGRTAADAAGSRSCGTTGAGSRRSATRPRAIFDDFWQTALHDGVMTEHRVCRRSPSSLKAGWEKHLGAAAPRPDRTRASSSSSSPTRRSTTAVRQQRLAAGTAQADHASSPGTTPPS